MNDIITKFITFFIVIALVLGIVACSTTNTTSDPLVKLVDIKLTDEQYAFVCKKGNTELV